MRPPLRARSEKHKKEQNRGKPQRFTPVSLEPMKAGGLRNGGRDMNDDRLQKIIDLRHTLHQYPELSMEERETMRRIKAFLRENTGAVIVDREGWFYAVLPGSDPEASAIAFRADMDALPIREPDGVPYASVHDGVSHKCGHDGHCAALCGLAMALEDCEHSRTVYLIFQPGEEIGAGGELCAGLLREKEIAEVFAFHNLSGYPEGALVYRNGLTCPASEGLTVRLHGEQSHASYPEAGNNPAAAVSRVALFSQTLAERPHDGMALCTVAGIRVGAGDFGISPGEGELCLTLRAERETEMKRMERELLRYAAEQAEAAGLSMDCQTCDCFPETRNHGESVQRVLRCAKAQGIPAIEMEQLWRPSEDFGHYLKECPGALVFIGNGTDWPPLHTVEYDFNDRILPAAIRLFSGLCVSARPPRVRQKTGAASFA